MKSGLLFLSILALMIISSCEKMGVIIDECDDKELAVFSLEEEYGCVNTKYGMEIDLSNQFAIIRDKADFELLVSGTCTPEIDFSKFDLVIGKQGLSSGNVRIEYQLKQVCEKEDLQMKVTFFQNITTEAPNLTYHALIEKIGIDDVVDITIEEKFE